MKSQKFYEFLPSDVKITDSYFIKITEKDVCFLNSFNPDKLLYNFRLTAGIKNIAESSYSGWENTRIGGHTLGHYLAAAAQACACGYADTTGVDGKSLNYRLEYLIAGLDECQKSLGTGFIFGATMADSSKPELQFDKVESEDTSDTWVPWYTMHKLINGIVVTYKQTGNKTALVVAERLAEWVYNRVSLWTEEIRNRVLGIEYGGMNDCLYELYKCAKADGYKNPEHIKFSAHKFDEDSLFIRVMQSCKNGGNQKDVLNNIHANTTIPKYVGAINRYVTLTDEGESADEYLEYAKVFWDLVVNHHTYITGGNSECEHFGKDDVLDAERSNCNCETCNTHNMLKLTRTLFMITGERKYADYYENAFINSILASVNKDTGMTTYFQPMATGCFKTYCNPDVNKNYFWCCTGTGLENFTKLNEGIYFHNDNQIVVNQFVSSEVEWKPANSDCRVTIVQKSNVLESESVEFEIKCSKPTEFTLSVRIPDWYAGLDLKDDYQHYKKVWKNGEKIKLLFPMKITAFGSPDNPEHSFGFKYGPIVLATELGRDSSMYLRQVGVQCDVCGNKIVRGLSIMLTGNYGGTSGLPVLPTENIVVKESIQSFMKEINNHFVKEPVKDERKGSSGKLIFFLKDTNWPGDFKFSPYYLINNQRYGIYWLFTDNPDAEKQQRQTIEEANTKAQKLLQGIGIGYGAQTEGNETTFPYMQELGAGSSGNPNDLTRFAKKNGEFSYIFRVRPNVKNYFECSFLQDDNGKSICIKSGDVVIAKRRLDYHGACERYECRFEIPATLLDRDEIRISFSGIDGEESARIVSPAKTCTE